MFTRALEGSEAALRSEHPRTLATMHNYAVLLAKQGHTDKATPLLERVVEGREKALGKDHPDTLLRCVRLMA